MSSNTPESSASTSPAPEQPGAPKQSTSAPSTSKTEKITCAPCAGRTKLLNGIMNEIKEAEEKAAHFESDAKKTDATEVAIRDLKKKMEEMEKVKKEVQTAIESRKKDVEKIEMEGEQLKEKKESLEGDLKQKQQETHELQEQNTELMKEIKSMKIQMDRMPQERSSTPEDASQQSGTAQVSTKPVLLEWRAKKDAFNKDASLQEKKDKILSVRLLTTDPKMWDFMEYEIFHFNTTSEIYLEVIEMNIQKIKKTSNTSDLLPLPPYPEITEQFKIALEHLESLPQEPAHHDASDDPEMNCYICRNDYENGDQVLICKTCKKPVHRSCWMKWLAKQQIKTADQTCGLCRGPMIVRERK
ncbi:unnamed protein product [Caenorhabditis brenneri]